MREKIIVFLKIIAFLMQKRCFNYRLQRPVLLKRKQKYKFLRENNKTVAFGRKKIFVRLFILLYSKNHIQIKLFEIIQLEII